MQANVHFELSVPLEAQWQNIEHLRSSILACIVALFDDAELGYSASSVAQELMENALRHGDWGEDKQKFGLEVFTDPHDLHIAITSPVGEESDTLANLEATLEFLRAAENRKAAFEACLKQLARGEGRGLGLARAYYEAECDFLITREPGHVVVHARCPLALPRAEAP